jgi:hypothetical protein
VWILTISTGRYVETILVVLTGRYVKTILAVSTGRDIEILPWRFEELRMLKAVITCALWAKI